ncbi:MAG TPA: imidazoleglycerol-phosphate dehydratase HisB [Kiritimatiellia bacterium]|jgi:imidazoleglycerol-phosphate dehydratase|nr:imidazoleglycerol-phosphate dehydratase HisB [Kiritimatiellia bacterium]HOM59669.1 imidazoleglycerol-phosphate dehydratase HisB [Kiritimatiellia bacterium]HOR97660.1 imidazoleglycerol-phosphate dehydratase HisB [Kiritimatiellia bacterium]HPC48716.1 imidazoleglycerol-phosphate dehydratase HisB [Kiritimatiellia bacterium]HPW75286.1 imidazoleglycerol-phosphate dehydratase HisB [Kiritimatiellia bacterium]
MARTAARTRTTRETDIAVTLNLDGSGVSRIETGVGFFDHMLELLARHALVDLEVRAKGDVHVDYHHTVEDVGLVLGACLNEALGERRGIRRYGFALLPMDEALCEVVIDLGGRPFLVFASPMKHMRVRDFEMQLLEEFFRAVTVEGRLNLHVRQVYGDETHHVCEAIFKGFARALRMAVEPDPRETGIPSSKGTIA